MAVVSIPALIARIQTGELEELSLKERNLSAEEITTLANTLMQNSSIRKFEMESCPLGYAGSRSIAQVLKGHRGLTHVNLHGTRLGSEGASEIALALNTNTIIKILKLGSNVLERQGEKTVAEMLKIHPTLEELHLQSNRLTGVFIAAVLPFNMTLRVLNLSGNPLDVEGGKAVGTSLAQNQSLIALYLKDCKLGDMGAEAFSTGLSKNITLQIVDLSLNQILAKGAAAIETLLETHQRLVQIILNENGIQSVTLKRIESKLEKNRLLAQKDPPVAKPSPFIQKPAIMANPPSVVQQAAPQQVHYAMAAQAAAGPFYHHHSPANHPELVQHNSPLQSQVALLQQQMNQLAAAQQRQQSQLAAAHNGQALLIETNVGALSDEYKKQEELDARLKIKESEKMEQETQLRLIEQNIHLKNYYDYFQRALTGTWFACMAISSGLVENGEKFLSDRVAKGLEKVGKNVPGINIGTSILAALVEGYNEIEKRNFVNRVSLLFPDMQKASEIFGLLAIELTIKQQQEIEQAALMPLSDLEKLKSKLLIKDIMTAPQFKGIKDCEKIMKEIKEEKIGRESKKEDYLQIVLKETSLPSKAFTAPRKRADDACAIS